MKKFLSILSLLATIAFSLVGCGPEEDPVVAVTGVSLNQTSVELEVGGTVSLNATVSPSNATDKTVTWSSSNANVATVSGGIVKAVGEGTATITASAGGKKATCQVTVSPVRIAVTGISLDKPDVSLAVGDTTRLMATITPDNATDKSVAWSSSNTSVATVDANGIVTAVTPGTCTITAQSGNFSATCAVTCVTAGFPEGELPPDNEIWYTTSDNKALAQVNNQGSCVLTSNTYTHGMGILRFSGPLTSFGIVSDNGDQCSRLTGLLIPDSVEQIGPQIFWSAPHIKEFRIPASLKSTHPFTSNEKLSLERFTGHHISEDGRLVIIDGTLMAFAPAGLSSYEIPSGVVRIAENAFALTHELRSIVIPNGVTALERGCFSYSNLESITIPASVTAIDVHAFILCHNLKNLLGDSHFISADRKFLYVEESFYPMMMFYFAGRDDESYAIPEGICAVENYTFTDCSNLKSITFPESLTFIAGGAFDGCNKLEALYGSHVTSDHKGFVVNHELQLLVPSISDDYVIADDVTALGDFIFNGRTTLRSVTMGDQVTTIGNYAFSYCPALKSITMSANLIDIGYNPFERSQELESVYFRGILPPSCSAIDYASNPKLSIYVPAQAIRLYTENVQWKLYWDVMKPYEYNDLPVPDFYLSTDYSKEGEVTVYQKASEGNGIDVVFMGDAYSDRQVASGLYLNDMKACIEQFFAVEPYKSFRKLFNIYIVTTVSATEGYERGGRSLGTYRGNGTFMGGNDAKCFDLAKKAVQDDKRMDEVLILVCGYQDLSGIVYVSGSCNFYEPETWTGRDYACGPAVTYFSKIDESFELTGETLRHESGGHGFAKLADEYYYAGTLSTTDKELIKTRSPHMWYSNVDITSDPAQVKWAKFLADDRYKSEISIYEGGFTYQYGVWRPSENSIMNDNRGGFNAPSRYTIWQRIHKLAYGSSWNGTYEDFVAYDVINRKTAPNANAPARAYKASQPSQRLSPPVVTGRTWRNAVNNSKK